MKKVLTITLNGCIFISEQGNSNKQEDKAMIRTYNSTTFIEDLTTVKFRLFIHEATKYEAESDDEVEAIFTNVKSWSIIDGGKEAEEIESETDASGIDENHEYLVLNFANGEMATFRNSHVDMFIR